MAVIAPPNTTLAQFVKDQCQDLDLHFEAEEPQETPTQEEHRAIQKTNFPEDLNFIVPVNLVASKKAFLAIVSGLSEDVPSFEDLWQFKPHDPRADYNPMGAVDTDYFDFLTSSSPQGSRQESEAKERCTEGDTDSD